MEDFNVNISVSDCCYNKCNSTNNSTTKIFTDSTSFLSLQCNYYLKIIDVNNSYIIISIDNGIIHFVRRIFINVPIKICIPNNCSTHIVTITVNSIAT